MHQYSYPSLEYADRITIDYSKQKPEVSFYFEKTPGFFKNVWLMFSAVFLPFFGIEVFISIFIYPIFVEVFPATIIICTAFSLVVNIFKIRRVFEFFAKNSCNPFFIFPFINKFCQKTYRLTLPVPVMQYKRRVKSDQVEWELEGEAANNIERVEFESTSKKSVSYLLTFFFKKPSTGEIVLKY